MFNWADVLVIVIVLLYLWDGYRRGFLRQTFDFIGILVSLFVALKFYQIFSDAFITWGLKPNIAKPLGFLAIWAVVQIVFYISGTLLFRRLPVRVDAHFANRILGVFPGLARGIMLVAVFLIIMMVLPFPEKVKEYLSSSMLASRMIKSTAKVENQMAGIFGQLNNTMTFVGIVSQKDKITYLEFKTDQFAASGVSENAIVNLVNAERVKAGLEKLEFDVLMRNVARVHSADMLRNGYFGHQNLAGKTPFGRMFDAGVEFRMVGENLALAPTSELAHVGLMNSPSHRANILEPNFRRIGVGVMDAGPYGKMVTQNFAD